MTEAATRDFRIVPAASGVDPLGRTHRPVLTALPEIQQIPRTTMDLLPVIPVEDGDSSSGLRLGGTIGQGGMGLVRKATQTSLDREVAAKTIRADRRNPETVRQLLQEAWITGRLEHPNIVPVYSLGQTEEGIPIMVMKRIEGTRWTMMMHNPAARPDDAGPSLKWNLNVLKQVTNAIEFAHQKGIIHRDLKPDNVMVGAFGEVYVLDWGLAVSLDDDGSGRLPHVSQVDSIVGTPSYMAPEMFSTRGAAIGPWTDVYLLGAMLHKILTGEPPHSGNLEACFDSANRIEPREYDASVPKELADICRKAMHREPRLRFQSAREVRESINLFLEHSVSVEVSLEASTALEKVRGVLEHNTTLDEDADALLGRTIFAFEHALRVWSGNEDAEVGLQASLEYAFHQAIAQQRLTAAEHWLSRMPRPRTQLVRELMSARLESDRRKADAAQVEAMRRGEDLEVGREQRLWLVAFSAIVLGSLPWVDAFVCEQLRPSIGEAVFLLAPGAGWVIAFGAIILGRKAGTQIAERIGCVTVIGAAMNTLTRYLAFTGSVQSDRLLVLDLFSLLIALATLSAFVDRRLRPALGFGVAVFALMLHAPSSQLPALFALAHILSIGCIGWIWSRPQSAPKAIPA